MFGEFPFGDAPFGDLPAIPVATPAIEPASVEGPRSTILAELEGTTLLQGRTGVYRLHVIGGFPISF